MPNDEDEQTRMQMLDLIFYHMLDDQLTTVPLEDPRKILDIGTGIGHWAIDMAEMYPKAEVIGIDIAKIQPTGVPVNVFFNIDNAEADGGWTWPDNEFDFVHLRSMGGAFQDVCANVSFPSRTIELDFSRGSSFPIFLTNLAKFYQWDHIYKEAFKHLKPGGWIEVLDFDNLELLQSYFAKDSVVAAWFQAVNEATIKSGFLRGDAHLQDYCLARVGFANVSTTTKKIPLGAWPRDSQEKKVGKHFLVTQLSGIEAVCLRLFTEQLGWDVEKVNEICSATMKLTRAVAMNPKKSHGLGFNMRILVGRKPSGPEVFNDSDDASKVGSSLRTVVNGYSTNTL